MYAVHKSFYNISALEFPALLSDPYRHCILTIVLAINELKNVSSLL